MSEIDHQDSSPGPARPEALAVEYFEQPDGIAIHKRRAGGPAVFLFLWLIAWTVGCVVLAVMVFKEPALGTLAFAVPFWASWLFVAGLLVWMFFGVETLVLRRDAALFQRTALIRLTSRFVPRAEIHEFREYRSDVQENEKYVWGIEMVTIGKPLRFLKHLPNRERTWLVYQLNQYLGISSSDGGVAAGQAGAAPQSDLLAPPPAARHESVDLCEPLHLDQTMAAPPTDCDWSLLDDPLTITFLQRGRLNIAALAILLFMNAFWNGIVSVFVMHLFGLMPDKNLAPQGWGWWGHFLFLIPFEVIGLGLFAALVAVLLEPFRRTTWQFEPSRVVYRSRWPVYRRLRSWDVVQLKRLELRQDRVASSKRQSLSGAFANIDGGTPFELALIGESNIDLCTIVGLTEGEARWFAHQILTQRSRWFAG